MEYEKVDDTKAKIISTSERIVTLDQLYAQRTNMSKQIDVMKNRLGDIDAQIAGIKALGVKDAADVVAEAIK